MINLFILLTIIALPIHVSHADNGTKKIMRDVVENYIGLIPYIYGNKKENKKVILTKIKALRNSFQSSRHNKTLSAPNFYPLAKSLHDTFNDIYSSYNSANDEFYKYRLKRLTSSCVACHSQLPVARFKRVQNKYIKVIDKYLKNDSDKAYMAFFFRDYSKVAYHLENSFQKQKNKEALSQLIKVYLVNMNDKKKAVSILEKLAKNEKTATNLKAKALKWSLDLKQDIKSRPVAMNKEQWVRMLISKYLVPRKDDFLNRSSDRSLMVSYQVQRILYNYLVYHPTSVLVPEILYWIGILENKERNIELYTLGEMYFEQCITKYPKSYIAPQCYDAYKDAIYEGFTGSSGTNIPQEFQDKLRNYKKLIYTKN